MSERRHGTLAMRTRGECAVDPCPQCLEAGRRYNRRRAKLHAMGRKPYVDPAAAMQHVHHLIAAGMTIREIEAASGVHRTAIRVMLGDFPGRKPSKGIRPVTDAALRGVRPVLGPLPDGSATVDATGTRRRLQALMAVGYSTRHLAQMLGAGPKTPLQIARTPRVRADTARRVAALYDQLQNTTGPSARTARTAHARGYLGPAWWDPDTIDDPCISPDGMYVYDENGALVDAVSAPRAARVELMARRGLTRSQIASALGVPARYVARDLR